MSPVSYGLIGYSGKMGKEIDALLTESGYQCVYRVDKDGKEESSMPDILIDFSTPDQLEDSFLAALHFSVPLIVGTTGLLETHIQLLQKLSTKIPIIQSYNFSVGIQLLLKTVRYLSAQLPDWDASIVETHHRFKKDKPSGTAIMIQKCFEKPPPVESIRVGGVPGDHEVMLGSIGETLSIHHRAISRRTFAEGVQRCIPFALDAKPGFYTFTDVLFPKGAPDGLE
jgi:4-hydroxy-tetrahydrodipicolinate reductase